MTPRKLLATAAAAAAALACSVAAYGAAHGDADLATAGAPDMLGAHGAVAGHTTQVSTESDPQLTVSTISQSEFTVDTMGLSGCLKSDGMQFCQAVQRSQTTWEVYLDLGQPVNLAGTKLTLVTTDQGVGSVAVPAAPDLVAGPYVKLRWSSSTYDTKATSTTYTTITVAGTTYNYRCNIETGTPGSLPLVCAFTSIPPP